jgi:putative membrane protein
MKEIVFAWGPAPDPAPPPVTLRLVCGLVEATMIGDYTAHAANERTFLAWVRTGIAVIAFGFFIEKFNLFMLTLASAALTQEVHGSMLGRLSGRIGRYDGLVLIFGGVGLVILATARFVRTTRLLDDPQVHSARSVRTELVLCACLVVIVSTYSLYLAFG